MHVEIRQYVVRTAHEERLKNCNGGFVIIVTRSRRLSIAAARARKETNGKIQKAPGHIAELIAN